MNTNVNGKDPAALAAPRPLTEGEANAFEHTSYVLVAKTHICTSCGSVQNFSDLHEVWTHPTKTALSNAKILKAAHELRSGFPIATVCSPTANIPICHECLNGAGSTEGPRDFPPLSYAAWSDTIQRKAQDLISDRREAAARTTRPAPTLDML